jgi:uncharacterized membrane protein
LAALIPFTLAVAVCSVPWLMVHAPALGFALQRGFALVCHQRADRSFFFFGGSVAVCCRCLGIYLGAALGMLFRVPRQLALRLLLGAATINLADRLAELGGLHGNWMITRFALGLALGAAAALFVVANSEEVNLSNHALSNPVEEDGSIARA